MKSLSDYSVEVKEMWTHTVRVSAKSEEEALERVLQGKGNWDDFKLQHILTEEMRVIEDPS